MIIINSGAYVASELQAEFGAIPPCMLPLANRKLIEHQVRALSAAFPGQAILVSLPAQYVLTEHDAALLDRLGVRVVQTPDNFSLCAALMYILSAVASAQDHVRLLRGDTLFGDFPKGLDLVSVAPSPDDYKRERERLSVGDGLQMPPVCEQLEGFEERADAGSQADGGGRTETAGRARMGAGLQAETGDRVRIEAGRQTGSRASDLVWTGFFAFSSVRLLLRSLALAKDSFTEAVKLYARECTVHSAPAGRWFDLGHINTYFRSRSALTTQRAFNTLNVDANIVTKTGTPPQKIEAEANWFQQVPRQIKKYIPQLISHGHEAGQPYYQLEYLPLSPLNELFVHGRNSVSFWEYAFDLIEDFFIDAASVTPDEAVVRDAARKLYADKTRQRLRMFTDAEGLASDRPLRYAGEELPPLQEICEDCLRKTLDLPCAPGILHGDLCLSNILIDLRSDNIKVIDPRGLDNDGRQTIYGDQKYDLAKLAHSCIGLYDFIISGYYRLESANPYDYALHFVPDERLLAVQAKFWNKRFLPQCAVADILPLTVLLFFSMLPLHSDDHTKQQALFANALRLYRTHVRDSG